MEASGIIIGAIISGISALAGSLGTVYMNMKAEGKKQKLKFEYSNLQKVLDDRKVSYRKIIEEMYKAVKMVRLNQPYDEEWKPIKEENFESTRETLIKELPFADERAARAIKLFIDILGETVLWAAERDAPTYSPAAKDNMIRRAYRELEFLYDQVTIFLRSQINLEKEVPPIISKVALLETCRYVTIERFEGLTFPNQKIIKLDGLQSPMDILRLAENNLFVFKRELTNFLNSLKRNPLGLRNTESLMSEITNIERLLTHL